MLNPRALTLLLLAAALCWHGLDVLSDWRMALREQHARDFASYYYAVDVALEGGDPYDRANLGAAARGDATRRGVHPFFYPPPYLLTMLWVAPLDLVTAWRVWFWLDELFALLTALALWRWWRPLGPAVGVTVVATLGLLSALPNNHLMGQMNLPVVLLVVLGLQSAERDRQLVGGVLLGLACMMKMSPAFFVAWWLLRGRWMAAFAAVGAALLLSLASLPLVGLEHQWGFYSDVLPGFASGRYNGLGVGIDIFGNHSLPNLYDDAFPAGPQHLVLSDTARSLSSTTMLVVVVAVGWLLRRTPADPLALAGQVGAVGVAMLLVPVFTYEHHLVWAWPAAVAVVAGLHLGRLRLGWAVPIGLSLAVWFYDLAVLKEMFLYVRNDWPGVGLALREAKLVALLVFLASSIALGRSRPAEVP